MKKLVRNLFAVIAATALVGSLASCADSDAEDPFATTTTNANSAGGNGGAGNGGGDNGNQGAQGAGSFDMPENEYDKGNTQYKNSTGIASLKVGDKVKMTFKGKASKTFKGEFFIVDTTKDANYWLELADKYEVAEVPVDFTIEHTFEITKAPKGTGSESTYFAVVGKDDATTIHIDYTELKFEKLGDSSSSGDTGNQQNNGNDSGTTGTPAAVVKTISVAVNHYENADHGIQYTENMADIPVNASAGDVWTLKIAGTADAEFRGDMQFVNANWAGITGESISKTFTTTAFSYEIDFTFSADCSDGKFMLGNAGMSPAVAKTLKLTEYSFTKKSGGSPSQNSGNEGNNGQAASTRSISGSKTDITVATASGTTPNVRVSFQYNRAQGESAITITNAVIKIYKNGEVIKELNKIDNFELNLWYTGDGSFSGATSGPLQNEDAKQYRALIALDGVSVVANDTISVEIASGTVNGAHTASLANDGLMSSLLDGDNSLCNWGAVGVVSADTQS